MSSNFYLSKTVRVFCLRDYQVCWLAETIEVICPFTFQRLQCLLSRLSQSSSHFLDYQSMLSCRDNQGHLLSLHFKDFNVFRQDYQSLLSRLSKFLVLWRLSMSSALYIFKDHQSLSFQRLSESSIETSMSPLLFKTSRSFVWCTWYLLHSFFWQVSLLGFPLVASRMARLLGWN